MQGFHKTLNTPCPQLACRPTEKERAKGCLLGNFTSTTLLYDSNGSCRPGGHNSGILSLPYLSSPCDSFKDRVHRSTRSNLRMSCKVLTRMRGHQHSTNSRPKGMPCSYPGLKNTLFFSDFVRKKHFFNRNRLF